MAEGLRGMLWGNPAALVAVVLGLEWKKDKVAMQPGKVMSVGDLPFHFATDRHGEQVQLPCTERLIAVDAASEVIARRLMPVLSVKGRDVVRLGSMQSLAGQPVRGRWTSAPVAVTPASSDGGGELWGGSAPEAPPPAAAVPAAPGEAPPLDDLDALLAGFGDAAAPVNPDSIDADLAALLEGL